MRQFALYSACIVAILAAPTPDKSALTHSGTEYDKLFAACDASGLSSSVMESLGLDPKKNYELNEDFITPFVKTCGKPDNSSLQHNASALEEPEAGQTFRQRLDLARSLISSYNPELLHSTDVLIAIALKSARYTGKLGVTLCDQTFEQIQTCRENKYCKFDIAKLNELESMSDEDREEELEYLESILEETRYTMSRLESANGDSSADFSLNEGNDPIVAEIIAKASGPSTHWMTKCMLPLKATTERLFEKYCMEKIEN